MKKKVLYIITKSDVGGAQKYVSDLANNLDKNRFEAKILYGGNPVRDENSLQAFATSNGIKLKWLSNKVRPWFLFANDWLAVFELVKIYKKEQPDVVHLNSSKAGVIGSLAAAIANRRTKKQKNKETKVVFTAHGWVFNPTNSLSAPVRWFYIMLHKFAGLFQDTIICVSEYDYNLALRHRIAPQKKLVMIHNGIDPKMKFLDKKTARTEIIKKLNLQPTLTGQATYNLQPELPWVGSIGRLVKEKNYETFIKAAALMTEKQRNKETKKPLFVLIGEGKEKEDLQLLIANYQLQDNFFIADPSGDDARYLKAFDVFVMSSVKEGLPYVLLEAMAAGVPAVVTEAGGIPEMIQNHENGLVVAQKSPEQLALAIGGLLENKEVAHELAAHAKKAVEEKFSADAMVFVTAAVYEKI